MTTAEFPWLNGWPLVGPNSVLVGSGMHCIHCGSFQGVTCVAMTEDWQPPGPEPTLWPHTPQDCPVCAA